MSIALAIIGAGGHASMQHAPAIEAVAARHRGAVRVVAVCDRDHAAAVRLARRFGAEACCHWEEAVAAPGLDAVLVCTPPAVTPEVATVAARHGLALWLEKPLGATLTQAETLAENLAGHRHQVSMNRRFDPVFARAAELLRGRHIETLHMRFARPDRSESDFITTTAIHALDLLHHLVGGLRLLGVEALDGSVAGQRLLLAGDRCDEVELRIEPLSGEFAERFLARGRGWRLEAASGWFDAGHLRLHGQGWDGEGMAIDPAWPEWVRNGNLAEAEHVLGALLGRSALGPTLDEVIVPTRIAHALAALDPTAV